MSVQLDDQETRVALALFRLMQNFGLLEVNLGLAIAHLENPGNSEKSYRVLARSSMEKMLERLGNLLASEMNHATQETSKAYEEWREKTQQARRIRNKLVHGWFTVISTDKKTPVEFNQPPWWSDSKSTTRMTVRELEENVDKVKKVFEEFYRFRKKHHI